MTLAILILSLATAAQGVRILGVFSMWGRSHHRFFQPVMRTLASAGHEVVVYSPFPLEPPHPNYTHVFLENVNLDNKDDFFLELTSFSNWKCVDAHILIYKPMYKEFIEDKKIIELISGKQKFDLIFTESYTSQEFTLVLGHILQAPIIALQPFPLNNFVNSHAGNALSLSYIPDICTSFSNRMSFYDRLINSFSIIRGLYLYHNTIIPSLEEMMREQFPDMPPISELAKSTSLYFVNDHYTADYARPRPPNIVPLAGIHVEPPKPLPQAIQKFMDEASDGVILFSLGTYVPDDLKPKEYFDMYINIFDKLKQRVIWKTRKEKIDGLPRNVLTLNWAPQPDVLAHPNCVLFITHGGLHSHHEAIHFGVPVVSIPQFYDQHRNARHLEEEGCGVTVAIDSVSEETMSEAIQKTLVDPSYRENIKRFSAIFKDQPLTPAQSVVYWTEYVLRHGGAAHLRPASTELRWYQLILLDVLTLIISIVICPLTCIVIILRLSCKYFKTRNEVSLTKKLN